MVNIIASSKPWHLKVLERLEQDEFRNWVYVTTREELEQAVKLAAPRYIFFLHWNWLVPAEIWKCHECVCFHMTDVPYGRGGSPLQNLIVAGQSETKITALRMIEEMDAGPVYAKRTMSLDGRAEEIYLRAGELSLEMLRWISKAEPVPVAQEGQVIKFTRRNPEQSALPKQGGLPSIYDHIRMLDAPTYPQAFVDHGDFRLELSHAEMQGEEVHARVLIRKTGVDRDRT